MNYRQELKRLGKRRRLYLPVMAALLEMHEKRGTIDFPVELIDSADILLLLELLDIEYLDQDAFTARSRFGTISSLLFHGGHPLSLSGESFIRQNRIPMKLMKIRRALRALIGG